MADNNTDDDIYDDPATIGDTDDEVNGQPDDTPPADADDPSQSIYMPEKNTTGLDDRGDMDEVEEADGTAKHDEMDGSYPEDEDSDADHLGDVIPSDEDDGTEA
jgi:hypothetical protein